MAVFQFILKYFPKILLTVINGKVKTVSLQMIFENTCGVAGDW